MTKATSAARQSKNAPVADKVKQDAKTVTDKAKAKTDEAIAQAESKADDQLNTAGEEVDELAQAIDAAAEQLSDNDKDELANYAHQLSSGMGKFAKSLRDKSVSQLASDAKDLARNNPNGFLLGSVALGFGLSRFAKASARRQESNSTSTPATGQRTPSASPADAAASTETTRGPRTDGLPGSSATGKSMANEAANPLPSDSGSNS